MSVMLFTLCLVMFSALAANPQYVIRNSGIWGWFCVCFFSNLLQKIIIEISIVIVVVVAETRNRIAERSVNCKRCRFVVSYKCLIKGRFITSIPFHFRKNWMTIRLDKDRGYLHHRIPYILQLYRYHIVISHSVALILMLSEHFPT